MSLNKPLCCARYGLILAGALALTCGSAGAITISFDDSCGTHVWSGNCVFFDAPNNLCYCSTNWDTGTAVTPNCSACAAEPGPADDVFIGSFYVDANANSPIHNLTTASGTVLKNTYIIQVSGTADYQAPVSGSGVFGGTGAHVFSAMVQPDSNGYFEMRWPAVITLAGGLNLPAGTGLNINTQVYSTSFSTWASQNLIIDDSGRINSAAFHNQSAATFVATGDGNMRGIIALGHFENAGIFRKDGGLGSTNIASEFTNTATGQIDVKTGTLVFSGPTTLGGQAQVAAGAVMEIDETATVPSSFSCGGAGPLRVVGLLNVNGTASVAHLELMTANMNGSLGGSGTLNVASTATLAGRISGGGRVSLQAGAQSTISGALSMDGNNTFLENSGNLQWNAGNISIAEGAVLKNLAGGVLECNALATMSGLFFTTGQMTNAGILRKSTGVGTTIDCLLTSTGTIDVAAGVLELHKLHQTAGQTMLNGGELSSWADTLHFDGGTLRGNGNIRGNVENSGAIVAPGASAGTITISGNNYGNTYTQGAGGTLDVDIGGTTPGTGYDQLAVAEGATIAGTLNLHVINGFTPNLGDTFSILTAGSVHGQFDTLNGLAIVGNKRFAVTYLPTAVVLTAVNRTRADFDGNGHVDPGDFAMFKNCATREGLRQTNSACSFADLDDDGDVDMNDYGKLQRCYSGNQLANPNCEN